VGGGTRFTYVLSDQNFPPVLPCSSGECLKIVRVENGLLSEIVSCFLEIMRGKGVPAGSVILLTSVSHMQMRGVAGYMADLGAELTRVGNSFRGGGVVAMPGVPILIGGCEDKTTVRALIEAGRWLSHSGSQHLQESMKVLATEIVANGKGGEWETEKFRHNMPSNLIEFLEQRSWVSGGWTIPCGVQPFTPEVESRIVQTIVRELNCLFDLDLGQEPICARLV
jgi:hypothetical protein